MNHSRTKPPLWLWGMANATYGLVAGYVFVPLPQMLVARGLPQDRIDAIVANCLLTGFWAFLISPVVDVRFSRRWYTVFFALLAGISLYAALQTMHSIPWFEAWLIIANAAGIMSSNALGGWLATIIQREHEAPMSAWTQVAAFIGYGTMAILPAELAPRLSPQAIAILLGALVALPAVVCAVIPMPAYEIAEAKRLAASFRAFGSELKILLKRREVLLALPLFLAPTASFALTNNLSGLGKDFHASNLFVSRASGVFLAVAGLPGCLAMYLLARRIRPLPLYFVIGIAGALFTLSLLALPKTPFTFGAAVLGENIFQATAYTTAVAIAFQTIGRENPLAGTQFGLLTAATVLPINYMGRLDGWAYTHGGLSREITTDALVSLAACALLAPLILSRRTRASLSASGNGGGSNGGSSGL